MMQSEQERHLHKSSPIFIILGNIKKIIFPVLLALFGSGGSYWEYIALAIALIVSLGAIIQYRFYRYWLEPNQIRVKEGIIFRNERQVPYNRIQNINLTQNPLHRVLGVVTVQLESASGGKPEAVISVIDMAAVKELKRLVHGDEVAEAAAHNEIDTNTNSNSHDNEPVKPALLRLPFAEIVRYGIITNKGLVILAVVFGFLSQLSDGYIKDSIETNIVAFSHWIEASFDSFVGDLGFLSIVIYGLLLLAIGLVGLWILSIGFALFKLHDFELLKDRSKLQATMGLLTRMQATIPMSRIQTLTVRNSLLHRQFKRLTVSIETAGGVNNDNQGLTIKEIAPLFGVERRNEMLHEIQPDVAWNQIKWQPIEPIAWRRIFKKLTLFGALISGVTFAIDWWYYPCAVIALSLISFLYAKAYVRNAGYCLDKDMIGFKSGVIFKKETYARLSKIQTVQVKENPFDRRYAMGQLKVDTAGATVGAHHIDIPYILLSDALKIQSKLVGRINHKKFVW